MNTLLEEILEKMAWEIGKQVEEERLETLIEHDARQANPEMSLRN
jgi:hypothetical protein